MAAPPSPPPDPDLRSQLAGVGGPELSAAAAAKEFLASLAGAPSEGGAEEEAAAVEESATVGGQELPPFQAPGKEAGWELVQILDHHDHRGQRYYLYHWRHSWGDGAAATAYAVERYWQRRGLDSPPPIAGKGGRAAVAAAVAAAAAAATAAAPQPLRRSGRSGRTQNSA